MMGGRRYLLLAAWALPWFGLAYLRSRGGLTDWYYFVYGGKALAGTLSAYHQGPLHLYAAHPELQIGPPALALAILITTVPGQASALLGGVVMLLMGLGAIGCIERTVIDIGGANTRTLGWGAILVVPFWAYAAGSSVHIDDALALLAITGALACLRAQRGWLLPAMLLGLAAASKPWAIIFAPLLLMLPPWAWKRAGVVYLASSLGPWLPFLTGDWHTLPALGAFTVPVDPHSILHLLGFESGASPHWVRSVQFYFGAAIVALCVQSRRWAYAVLAAFALRIFLDPQALFYYGLGPLLGALLLDIRSVYRWPVWTAVIAGQQYGGPMLFPAAAPWFRISWMVLVGIALVKGEPAGHRESPSPGLQPA